MKNKRTWFISAAVILSFILVRAHGAGADDPTVSLHCVGTEFTPAQEAVDIDDVFTVDFTGRTVSHQTDQGTTEKLNGGATVAVDFISFSEDGTPNRISRMTGKWYRFHASISPNGKGSWTKVGRCVRAYPEF